MHCSASSLATAGLYVFRGFRLRCSTVDYTEITAWSLDKPGQHVHEFFC